jgi:putative spermidine/putrescine transport system ATP-binding protein
VIGRLRFRLSKHFGAKNVLDDFALEVRGGELVTFLGPSGCGKSTALNLLAGLLAPSAGEIWLDERRIDALAPERRGFGMVFQNYALFPHLTVFENVAFGLSVRGVTRDEIAVRVARMLTLVKLEGFARRYPAQLSGGQQQRVAIARALVIEPRVLLLDEPLSNLDAKLRLEMRAEIKRLHAGLGLTSIYVTHDQAEALSLSDRIVVMREGRAMQVGPPTEIHDRPRNRFVADFVGYRNVIPLTVTKSGVDGMVLGAGAGLTLGGRATGPLRVGTPALAAVRPEDLRVTAEPPGLNVAQGIVRLVEYQGREYDVEVALASGLTLTARLAEPVAVGSPVTLAVDAGRVVFLAPDEGAAP